MENTSLQVGDYVRFKQDFCDIETGEICRISEIIKDVEDVYKLFFTEKEHAKLLIVDDNEFYKFYFEIVDIKDLLNIGDRVYLKDKWKRICGIEVGEVTQLASDRVWFKDISSKSDRIRDLLMTPKSMMNEYFDGVVREDEVEDKIADMKYRQKIIDRLDRQTEKGIKKYGQTLDNNDDLDIVEMLEYYAEELTDALVYIEKVKEMVKD